MKNAKKKILFLIHNLGQGGAEKVLVNLVNNMNKEKYDITVMTLFSGGVNEQFIEKDIKLSSVFNKMIPGNSKLMKLLSPKQLHKFCIHDKYDIEISYLEGPSARVISGCSNPDTKLVSWIHIEQHNIKKASIAFRSAKEANEVYSRFNRIVCVSDYVKRDFNSIFNLKNRCEVLYNTVESEKIIKFAKEEIPLEISQDVTNIVAIGTLSAAKGYDRLLNIILRLKKDGYTIHLYILGKGYYKEWMEKFIDANDLNEQVTLLGYDINPYKYVARCDLFVCASHSEGFSTATTESLIVGTPVCTVNVAGMSEMLGDNNEYGVITENSEEALFVGIKYLLDNPDILKYYKKQAFERGKMFDTKRTVSAVEEMLDGL